MTKTKQRLHWTQNSIKDFVYRIASDFVEQLDSKLDAGKRSHESLAKDLNLSKGRISQIFNNPGNFTLDMLVRCARAVGMKVAIVAYDDNDPENNHGPVDSEIFRVCWENAGKPTDYFTLDSMKLPPITASAMTATFYHDWNHSPIFLDVFCHAQGQRWGEYRVITTGEVKKTVERLGPISNVLTAAIKPTSAIETEE